MHVNIYNVPVKGEPEYGVSTKVVANYEGTPGYYGIGLGIDQESAIFISQELNGQPKFPCSIVYFRRDDAVEARCTHQGYTFLEFHGASHRRRRRRRPDDYEEHDWWIKSSRAVGGVEKSYDFPPHVVDVASVQRTVRKEIVDGTLVLRDSPWDPYTDTVADARAAVRAPRVVEHRRAAPSPSPARSTRSRSGPTPTPSAARAGPARWAARASTRVDTRDVRGLRSSRTSGRLRRLTGTS